MSSRRGPNFCPQFTTTDGDIFVASGGRRRVMVEAQNLQDQMTNFKCQYTVESEQKIHEKLAHRKGSRIMFVVLTCLHLILSKLTKKFSCDDMLFEYTNLGLGNGTAIAKFDIIWSPATMSPPATVLSSSVFNSVASNTAFVPVRYFLDNTQSLRVFIYKCEQLASNCGLCLGLDLKKFECGWCDVDLRCTHVDDCPRESGWLTKASASAGGTPVCPHPKIDDFYPKKGPINGGTKV